MRNDATRFLLVYLLYQTKMDLLGKLCATNYPLLFAKGAGFLGADKNSFA